MVIIGKLAGLGVLVADDDGSRFVLRYLGAHGWAREPLESGHHEAPFETWGYEHVHVEVTPDELEARAAEVVSYPEGATLTIIGVLKTVSVVVDDGTKIFRILHLGRGAWERKNLPGWRAELPFKKWGHERTHIVVTPDELEARAATLIGRG